jgi:hypothetical protein
MSEFEHATRGISASGPQYAERTWNAAIAAAAKACVDVGKAEDDGQRVGDLGHEFGRTVKKTAAECVSRIRALREGGGVF